MKRVADWATIKNMFRSRQKTSQNAVGRSVGIQFCRVFKIQQIPTDQVGKPLPPSLIFKISSEMRVCICYFFIWTLISALGCFGSTVSKNFGTSSSIRVHKKSCGRNSMWVRKTIKLVAKWGSMRCWDMKKLFRCFSDSSDSGIMFWRWVGRWTTRTEHIFDSRLTYRLEPIIDFIDW